jgi:quercetin dioxygenase-like cupin family protein
MLRPIACLASALAMLFAASQASAGQPAGVQSSVLVKSEASWEGTSYAAYPAGAPELSVIKITIPANTSLAWHKHPMPNAAYVLSGELTVETQDGKQRKVLGQGEALAEMVERHHRGTSGATPTELIVFYAGSKDMPLSVPVPE